jgi:hypothetical protein
MWDASEIWQQTGSYPSSPAIDLSGSFISAPERGSSIRLCRYGPALQLRGTSLCGTGRGRNDRCHRDATSGLRSTARDDRLLLGAGGFAADL